MLLTLSSSVAPVFFCVPRSQNAAEFYENAWTYGNGTDPVIGFKLAFNFYKAGKYVEAIDICHAVSALPSPSHQKNIAWP